MILMIFELLFTLLLGIVIRRAYGGDTARHHVSKLPVRYRSPCIHKH